MQRDSTTLALALYSHQPERAHVHVHPVSPCCSLYTAIDGWCLHLCCPVVLHTRHRGQPQVSALAHFQPTDSTLPTHGETNNTSAHGETISHTDNHSRTRTTIVYTYTHKVTVLQSQYYSRSTDWCLNTSTCITCTLTGVLTLQATRQSRRVGCYRLLAPTVAACYSWSGSSVSSKCRAIPGAQPQPMAQL